MSFLHLLIIPHAISMHTSHFQRLISIPEDQQPTERACQNRSRTLAWIPMEEERPNENASALPENSNIFALSAPWSLCGSKSYRGVSREVSRSIVYSAFVVQLSFRPGKIGIRRS